MILPLLRPLTAAAVRAEHGRQAARQAEYVANPGAASPELKAAVWTPEAARAFVEWWILAPRDSAAPRRSGPPPRSPSRPPEWVKR